MTEAEWEACTDPAPMLELLRAKASERKLRLFAAGCLRQVVWQVLTDESSRKAVEVAEQFADGLADARELDVARAAGTQGLDVRTVLSDIGLPLLAVGWACQRAELYNRHRSSWDQLPLEAIATNAAGYARQVAASRGGGKPGRTHDRSATALLRESRRQARLVRCVFRNPFRSVALDPAWLAWNDGTVRKLARVIYDGRAFDRMPLLADALEDAGCADPAILGHCRGGGEHVRGCWVLDLLLGKE